jgi:chromosomal replication initiator protein
MTIDDSASFFRTPKEVPSTESINRVEIQETLPTQKNLEFGVEQQTVTTPTLNTKENSNEITINDKDMLIKDMEGTLLGQMPLEDIFGAETKYDMFLDLENQQLVKNSQQQREQKINEVAAGKPNLEDSFNIFEQKIKDQTCVIDLEDLNDITDRLSQKDLGFMAHAQTAQETVPTTQNESVSANVPTLKPNPNEGKETGEPIEMRVQERPQKQEDVLLKTLTAAQGTFTLSSNLEEIPNVEEATLRWKIPMPEPKSPQEQEIIMAARENSPLPKEDHQTAPATDLPDEVELLNTVPPLGNNAEGLAQDDKEETLDKTFNLETTLNTEVLKTQYAKSFINHSTPPPAQTAPPEAGGQNASASQQPPTKQKQKILRLVGKKKEQPTQHNLTAIQREENMEENKELKATFIIKRKTEPAKAPLPPSAPAPAAPVAPIAPVPPVQPSAPAAAPIPAPTTPVSPAPAQPAPQKPAPVSPVTPAAANTILEKTKTIDHSIEIPLSELKKHNWPLEVPLVPTYTLENMVMSVNRFAHATAISVLENPGKMYNPLVFHGATGTGKTHFLNAMAYAFSKKYGQENIFMTNGVRLSRGIQRYVMEGNIEKFEKFMSTVKVLLIDDIHLIAINEQNRAHLSSLLNRFRQEQKQIVITSKYPPESLAKLEELLRFKLDSGWISELKPAKGPTHFKIVKKMLLDNGVDLNDSQITAFFGGPHMTLGTVSRSIRRLKVLENLVFSSMNENDRSQANIFEKLLATTGEDASSNILNKSAEDITSLATSGNGEWGRIGFFYPQNCSHMMNWMVYALEQRAKELGIQGGFEIAVRSSYATENVISSAFKIANLCDNKKLKGAVILGPQLTACDPSVRENFYDILTHMLEIMLIRCGIINFENVKAPSTYVKVISELMR